MTNMFKCYDHCADKKEYPRPLNRLDEDREMWHCTATRPLLNAQNKKIGIIAKQNSKFNLFFNFDGTAFDEDLSELIESAKIRLNILDFKHEILEVLPATLNDDSSMAVVEVEASEDGPLKYGVYFLELYMLLEGKKYTLFSESDGLLSIE